MQCFVIMPFGEKVDADGKTINFDDVYKYIIKSAVEEQLAIKCQRCDEIAESGWIHSKMFHHIYNAEIAIADITALNPNVFYELGVRHALAESVTVIVRRKGTRIPFNIQDFEVVDYELDMASVDTAKKKIADFIRNGLRLHKKDSPVHNILNIKIAAEPTKLQMQEVFEYKIKRISGKKICLVTGRLEDIKHLVDIWVSSENTNMQMSRPHERSVSGVIRFYGAKRNQGKIIEDTIANELKAIVGENANVDAATVVATGAGELERTHGVKKIFHAASVFGQVGVGYTPIREIGKCVSGSLTLVDSDEFAAMDLKSILFPLMGTGQARGGLENTAKELIDSAISYLLANRNSRIEKIYFLNWSDQELDVCQRVLQESPEIAID